jgi:hypothetical protein
MQFAKRVFLLAGVIGLIQIVPMYFLESYLARRMPPAINHPEWYYGFIGLCLPWQLVFILISRDPVRYRALMPLAMLEKLGFVAAVAVLLPLGRAPMELLPGPALDVVWLVLFAIAWRRTPARR